VLDSGAGSRREHSDLLVDQRIDVASASGAACEQLAVLRMEEGGPQSSYSFITPFFRSLEGRHEVFSEVFAYNGDTLQVRGRSGNENIQGALVSGQFFQALQTTPLMGRYLTPEDDHKGGVAAGLAVVISEHSGSDGSTALRTWWGAAVIANVAVHGCWC